MKLRPGFAVVMMAAFCTLAAQEPSGAFEGQIPVNCTLKKALSSRDAKVGQEIAAVTEKPRTSAWSARDSRDTAVSGEGRREVANYARDEGRCEPGGQDGDGHRREG